MTDGPHVPDGTASQGSEIILHATTVALDGRGVLIFGPSGSGKSGLALQLMALGAHLVADDRTILFRCGAAVRAACPQAIRGRIEARGLGILAVNAIDGCKIHLSVDMGAAETHRLPPQRNIDLLGVPIALVQRVESAHFPAAILQYLKTGRVA